MMKSHNKKKNIPLILIGIVLLVSISSLRAQLGGGIAVSIIQVCALVIILYGFGMSWTRKSNKYTARNTSTDYVNRETPTENKKVKSGFFKGIGSPISIAKMQKRMYDIHKRQNPNANKEKLRLMTVSTRTGFKEPDELLRLETLTKTIVEKLKHPDNFQTMVCVMIAMEFEDLNQNLNMTPSELFVEVSKIIPSDY